MANKTVSVLTGGSNNHQTTSFELNALATDLLSSSIVGAVSNTSGVAPSTGNLAVNAQGTPNMTVRVSGGIAYIIATPTGGLSQQTRFSMDSYEDVTINSNSSGSTKYDWVYVKLDPAKLANPAVDASDVATLITSRSTSATADNGTPPTYGYCLAVVTVVNNATSIANSSIKDMRVATSTSFGVVRFLPMTTTQRDAVPQPVAGMVVYNTTTGVLNFYNGTIWGAV